MSDKSDTAGVLETLLNISGEDTISITGDGIVVLADPEVLMPAFTAALEGVGERSGDGITLFVTNEVWAVADSSGLFDNYTQVVTFADAGALVDGLQGFTDQVYSVFTSSEELASLFGAMKVFLVDTIIGPMDAGYRATVDAISDMLAGKSA